MQSSVPIWQYYWPTDLYVFMKCDALFTGLLDIAGPQSMGAMLPCKFLTAVHAYITSNQVPWNWKAVSLTLQPERYNILVPI